MAAWNGENDDLDRGTASDVEAIGTVRAGSESPGRRRKWRCIPVVSINTSGHRYGLVYPRVGWVLWRSRTALPEELIFNVDYLGGHMPTFALNFSRPGAEAVAQYYTFFRLARAGFRAVQQTCRDVAVHLAGEIEAMGPFRLVSRGDKVPAFAFTTRADVTAFDVFDVSRRLRERGWLVPAPPTAPTSASCGSWSATDSPTTSPNCSSTTYTAYCPNCGPSRHPYGPPRPAPASATDRALSRKKHPLRPVSPGRSSGRSTRVW
jgi:pyridoxal-dependent decarboxylase-like protein